MEFLFEKLEVYKLSLELVESVDSLIETVKGRFPGPRIDQLSRASLSIPLNIAEGSGRRRPAERGHFFVIARGSAFECAAILQVLRRKKLISETDYLGICRQLMSITKMLSGLIKHVEMKLAERKRPLQTQTVAPSRQEGSP
jgi:four helix bundle protein